MNNTELIEKLREQAEIEQAGHGFLLTSVHLMRTAADAIETLQADRDELEIALHNRLEIDGIACDYCDLVDDCPQQDEDADSCEHWKWCRNLREADNE